MAENPDIQTCANPACNAPFTRLGEGKLFVFPIDDPEPWGLPTNIKQKAVWLCSGCEPAFYVRLDRTRHRVHIAHKPTHHHRVA